MDKVFAVGQWAAFALGVGSAALLAYHLSIVTRMMWADRADPYHDTYYVVVNVFGPFPNAATAIGAPFALAGLLWSIRRARRRMP